MAKADGKIYKVDVAREWRSKHPDMPTAKLSRIIYNANKTIFDNPEQCRDALRSIEGKRGGEAQRRSSGNMAPEFLRAEARPTNPYKLPKSDETIFEPEIIKGFKRVAFFSDIHAPYHNIEALTASITFCKKDKVDAVVIAGDLFDFHGMSRFMRDPRKKNFAEELRIGVQIVETIERELGCPVFFKLGNHDERYQHFLWQKAGELMGVEEFEFAHIINSRLPDVKIVDDKRIIKLNDLCVVHGHEFGGSVFSPVNIARGFYLRAKASTIGGHHHRTSEHTEQDINQRIVTTWSVGCLCELHPAYLPINAWNHGFAVIDLDGDVEYHVRNKRIYKGKIL